MIRKTTWIVLAAFGVVLLAAFLLNSSRDESAPVETTPAPQPLWTVASEEIVGLIVEDLQAGETIELERDPEDLWHIVSPRPGAADPARVERAVSWLASPAPRAEIPEATDLQPFQLDEPNYRIEVRLADGSKRTFSVGREAPTGGSRYVSLPGRVGVLVVTSFGLDEVLTLHRDLLPTPTPEPTLEPTLTEPVPGLSGTPLPTLAPTP
ncbi:MAG TPA: DUF4340 domain-containing protein [Anaerolineales bacterium]